MHIYTGKPPPGSRNQWVKRFQGSWLTFVKGCSVPGYFMHVVTCGHLLQDAYTMMPMHADICRYWDHAYLATRSGAIMKASNQANTQAKSGVSGEQRTNLPMCPDVLCLNELSGQTLSCHKQGSCITQNYAT